LQGDSGNVLNQVLAEISQPALFWLDGHYSEGITAKGEKECPIIEELSCIFKSKRLNHLILIDDARLFIGRNDYPTIQELTDFIFKECPNASVDVSDDMIKCNLLY
jgi:hypothetical protein